MTIAALSTTTGPADRPNHGRIRVLWVACGAHALHDGLTDTLYLLLPLWQAEFGLGYAARALHRRHGRVAGSGGQGSAACRRSEDARGRHRYSRGGLFMFGGEL